MDISFEFVGMDKFADMIAGVPKRFEAILQEELKKVALQAERYARQLAPYDTGDLEASINTSDVYHEGSMYIVYIGTNKEYAKYVHELNSSRVGDKYEKGIKLKNYYIGGRGKRTRDKPNIRGYAPGRKYLKNALVLTETHLKVAMDRTIKRVFEEG